MEPKNGKATNTDQSIKADLNVSINIGGKIIVRTNVDDYVNLVSHKSIGLNSRSF